MSETLMPPETERLQTVRIELRMYSLECGKKWMPSVLSSIECQSLQALSWWGSPGKRHISSEEGGGCHAVQDEKHELFLNFFFFSLKITLLKQNEKASEGKFTTWGNRLTARSLLGQGGCVASVAVCGTVRECPSRD